MLTWIASDRHGRSCRNYCKPSSPSWSRSPCAIASLKSLRTRKMANWKCSTANGGWRLCLTSSTLWPTLMKGSIASSRWLEFSLRIVWSTLGSTTACKSSRASCPSRSSQLPAGNWHSCLQLQVKTSTVAAGRSFPCSCGKETRDCGRPRTRTTCAFAIASWHTSWAALSGEERIGRQLPSAKDGLSTIVPHGGPRMLSARCVRWRASRQL